MAGVSRCAIVRVEGRSIHVRGLDAIDGTPVLDVKPYMREFGPRGEVKQPGVGDGADARILRTERLAGC